MCVAPPDHARCDLPVDTGSQSEQRSSLATTQNTLTRTTPQLCMNGAFALSLEHMRIEHMACMSVVGWVCAFSGTTRARPSGSCGLDVEHDLQDTSSMWPAEGAAGWAAMVAPTRGGDEGPGEDSMCGIYEAMGWAAMFAHMCAADEAPAGAAMRSTGEGTGSLAEDAMGAAAAEAIFHAEPVPLLDEVQVPTAAEMACTCTDSSPMVCIAPRACARYQNENSLTHAQCCWMRHSE